MIEHPLAAPTPVTDALPTQVYIEVTNHCNSLCTSCPLTYQHFKAFEPRRHLSWADFRQIVDQYPLLERVVLHGIGEPLLNPELPRFVRHLKERGAQVLFNSNGLLLDEVRGDALAAAGLDELRISLDAVTPELYAHLRGVDRLPQVLKNVGGFVRRHGGREKPRVSLWWIAMQANLPQLPDLVRLAARIGVAEVYMQRLVYFGDGAAIGEGATMRAGQSLHAILEDEQKDLISNSEELARELGVTFRASGAANPSDSVAASGRHPWRACRRPWTLMYITANGTALPCCISPFAAPHYAKIVLGNALEQPVTEIWNGESYAALRFAVLSDDPAPWPCRYCGSKWSL